MGCKVCGSPFSLSHFGDCRAATSPAPLVPPKEPPTFAWLIESGFEGGRPEYWCGPSDWCTNPNHAHKFATEAEAKAMAEPMHTIGSVKVTEHQWG